MSSPKSPTMVAVWSQSPIDQSVYVSHEELILSCSTHFQQFESERMEDRVFSLVD